MMYIHIHKVNSYNLYLQSASHVEFSSLVGFEDLSHSFFSIFISIIILCLSSMTNKRVHDFRVSVHRIRVGKK